jgi:hypothetical protein
MTSGMPSEMRPVVTLVLRFWQARSHHHSEAFHFQATHVQTGDVTYFRTIEGVSLHIERLAQALVKPIDLSEMRRRSEHV